MRTRKHALAKHPVIRIILIWLIESLALALLAFVIPGLQVDGVWAALFAAGAIGLLNALLWPLLTSVLLPFAVFTMGLLTLVLNGAIIWLAGQLVEGFHVESLWTAVGAAIGLTLVNTIVSALLTIDDDSSYYRNVVRRHMKRRSDTEGTAIPGILFLEIDGLAKPVLERAMAEGFAPTLARAVESGSHRLVGWECDTSSQTSASQAGLLLGSNDNIPAFRWWDRERKMVVSSSDPREVARLEEKLTSGDGLLVNGGASRGNLFSGDATEVMNTASTIQDLSRFSTTDYYPFFVNPYNFSRTLILIFGDIFREIYEFWQARRKDVQPRSDRHKRGGIYPLMRAFTTVLMRELNIETLIGDIFAGVPSAYATFVGYDEVAHHSGVESQDAFDVLKSLDQQFGRLISAVEHAPRPYHFVVLSDHGQSAGATFKQRYGATLEELVQELAREYRVHSAPDVHEDWKHVNVFLTEASHNEGKRSRKPLRRLLRRHTGDGRVQMGPETHAEVAADGTMGQVEGAEPADEDRVIVLASGNLGLVYGTRRDERATLEEIEEFYPGVLDGLAAHEGIGFLMVHSEKHGAVVIGDTGRYYLAEDRVDGENPLEGFGPNAAEHLRRTDSFPDAPDILVNSFYRPENNEVAAFEELIGSHGGLGGYQSEPFVLYPAEWGDVGGNMVGAEAVYRQFKTWLEEVQGQAEAEAAVV